MSSTLLNLDNDYQFPAGPNRPILDRATWNGAMADIAAKLRAVLSKGAALDDLLNDLSFNAQTRVDATITPIVAAVQADLANLAEQVAATLAANQQIIENFQAVTAVNLEELDEKIDEVEQRIAVILAGGLAAENVQESSARVFVTAAEKAEISQLREDVDSKASGAETSARFDEVEASIPRQSYALSLHFGS